MEIGLRLGVQPEAFWRLSLWEWRRYERAFLAGARDDAPMGRAELRALMDEYPDERSERN